MPSGRLETVLSGLGRRRIRNGHLGDLARQLLGHQQIPGSTLRDLALAD